VYNYTQSVEGVQLDSRALIRILVEGGWREVRVAGSHHTFKHPERPLILTVPHPKKDLPIGTVNSILKKAGLK
jgi:predicted RNA binding protein YcfA (HicA-like mRNA interferase family)